MDGGSRTRRDVKNHGAFLAAERCLIHRRMLSGVRGRGINRLRHPAFPGHFSGVQPVHRRLHHRPDGRGEREAMLPQIVEIDVAGSDIDLLSRALGIRAEVVRDGLHLHETGQRPLAAAAADMLAWENSGFSVDASVRITLIDRDVPSYFQSLEHLLRYCARPPFALERLSVRYGADGRATRVRYVLPRHKAANWVGPGRSRTSTRPGANGVVDLSPFEFLDRLADLVPPPRKHRHRSHGVFAPIHRLRKAVTALAIGNVGKRREAAAGGHAGTARATEGCCDATPSHKPRSHDTSRIAWAKLLARAGEEFPLECPWVWRRHSADRVHHGARADPQDPLAPPRTARTAAGRPTRPISPLKDSPSAGRPLRKCR